MVGRIGWQKDPELFAQVAELVTTKIDFTWVGDGDPAMKDRLLKAGVRVSGWISPEQVRRMVAASHLYVHTGAWEAAPISAIEAAALGTPVIARAIPAMSSLGYYTVNGSAQEIAESVDRFFTNANHRKFVLDKTEAVAQQHTVHEARRLLREAYDEAITTHLHRPGRRVERDSIEN
ncbi:glycosyltransferase [Arthrobacter sp. NtRootA1]|uniref:glycosyltransferase n=1 Tax=Arthrobacter sp. NtRootA1 TaxID=2830983 RepID=UPI0021E1035A|nr:glycosyltransferase [Arthrobacter sp. NtRootA1]